MPTARSRSARIRRATFADLADIVVLERAAFQPWRQASLRSLLRSLRSKAQSVWVIDAPSGGLAALLVLWHRAKTVRVYDVATRPDLQGHGFGGRLMAHAEALATRAGCSQVVLEADPKDRRLVQWYTDQGYAVVRRLPAFYHGGRPGVRMRKRL